MFSYILVVSRGYIGVSSLFINLILKTLHYFHMKSLKRGFQKGLIYLYIISGSGDTVFAFKVQKKEVIFLGRFSLYEIPESGYKIFNL